MDTTASQVCTYCKGVGTRTSPAIEGFEARTYRCHCCDGKGTFPALDVQAIAEMISAGKGDKKRFRKAWPSKLSPYSTSDVTIRRAYFVWRIARFHGGADVTMPMMAGMVANGDPFKPVLEELARVVAVKVFGNHRAGASRWARAMGYQVASSANEPASAFEGGPVVTEGQKPAFEALELE